jgi:tungsten cofactor oxidoreducase radical SAM maturase
MGVYRFNTGEETIELPLKLDVKKIYIEPTTSCNYSCITCIRHSWSDDIGHMTWSVFEKLLKDMADLPNLKTVHFGGFGEPLSHPRMIDMLANCKSLGYVTEMITNGSLLTSKVAAQLIDIGLDWIYISLDGPDEDSFSQIRPGGSFEDVTRNIRMLQALKEKMNKGTPQLGVEFVATKTNFSRLPTMRSIVDELGANRFIITNVLPYHDSMKNEIIYNANTNLEGFGWESPLLSVKSSPDFQLRTQRTCKFVQDKALVITHQGNVSPCYAFMHSYNCYILGREKTMLAHNFGNVLNQTLSEIWQDPKYAVFRWMVRNVQYPSCIDCRQGDGCVMAQTNEADCWGNQPSCGDCLWARNIVVCP